MYESMKTITLKIYNISSYKKSVIDEAMTNYSKAFQFLLDNVSQNIENIIAEHKSKNSRYKAFNVDKWINADADKKLSEFNVEPFKDALKIDFAGVLLEYLNKTADGIETSFPSVFISDDEFENEYNKLMNEYINKIYDYKTVEEKIKRILKLKDRLRPLFFCRYSINRSYSLLYDPKKNKYYAKIYLMNSKNDKRKVSEVSTKDALNYISRENKAFKKSNRKNCFLIFPLSFGVYQEEYLKKAVKNPDILRTARLIRKKDDYFLSISIIDNTDKDIEPLNYMGISRSLSSAVNYAIVNFEGNILSEGFIKMKDKQLKYSEINRIANCLAKIAEKNKSQIIMENLVKSADGLGYKDRYDKMYKPVLNSNNYNNLFDVLNKKILGMGLHKIIKVSSRNIYYTCPNCGNTSKLNRFSENIIICTKCGMYSDIEKAGSLNLSRRLIKYSSDKIKIVAQNTENGLRLSNDDLGFEFYPENPFDCIDEFNVEIDKLIKEFYININSESREDNFMKKLSMIKKIEKNRKIFELINLN